MKLDVFRRQHHLFLGYLYLVLLCRSHETANANSFSTIVHYESGHGNGKDGRQMLCHTRGAPRWQEISNQFSSDCDQVSGSTEDNILNEGHCEQPGKASVSF